MRLSSHLPPLISFYVSSFGATLLSLSKAYLCYVRLSGALVGNYLLPFEFLMGKISVHMCIHAIRTIRVIRVIPCDLRRESLRDPNLSVSSHIRAPLNLFSGLPNSY